MNSLVWICIINLAGLATLFVVMASHKEISKHQAMAIMATVLGFPIGGLVIVWLMYFYKAHAPHDDRALAPLAKEASTDPKTGASYSHALPGSEAELNVAPLQDVLLLADSHKRRTVMLDLLKSESTGNIKLIQQALLNEDPETVHFAASGLQNIRQKLDARLFELSGKYHENPANQAYAREYADLLHDYLKTMKIDPDTRLRYLNESTCILNQFMNDPQISDIAHAGRLVEQLFELGQYPAIKSCCEKIEADFPASEEKYTILLRTYFLLKDKEKFSVVFNQLRQSNVEITDHTLNVIRLWMSVFK